MLYIAVRSQGQPSLPGIASLQGGYHESTTYIPLGSSGGPDGITLQHIRDLLAGSTDDSLQQALVDFLNLMLAGAFGQEISSIIFGGRLIALSKTVASDPSVWATLWGGWQPNVQIAMSSAGEARSCSHNSWVSESQVGLRQQCMQQEDLSAIYQLVTIWKTT